MRPNRQSVQTRRKNFYLCESSQDGVRVGTLGVSPRLRRLCRGYSPRSHRTCWQEFCEPAPATVASGRCALHLVRSPFYFNLAEACAQQKGTLALGGGGCLYYPHRKTIEIDLESGKRRKRTSGRSRLKQLKATGRRADVRAWATGLKREKNYILLLAPKQKPAKLPTCANDQQLNRHRLRVSKALSWTSPCLHPNRKK
jgi:hypothetical protein